MSPRWLLTSVVAFVAGIVGVAGSGVASAQGARERVIVEVASADSTQATLTVIEQTTVGMRTVLGPVDARVGRNGVLRNHREGDGTTPLGTFRITGAFGLGASATTNLSYRRLRVDDCWISDVADPAYNTRVRRPRCATPNEDLRRIAMAGPYEFALTTDYNSSPVVVGKGSAIFIHVHSYDGSGQTRPTSGCVSVSRTVMKRLLAILQPEDDPVLVVRIRR